MQKTKKKITSFFLLQIHSKSFFIFYATDKHVHPKKVISIFHFTTKRNQTPTKFLISFLSSLCCGDMGAYSIAFLFFYKKKLSKREFHFQTISSTKIKKQPFLFIHPSESTQSSIKWFASQTNLLSPFFPWENQLETKNLCTAASQRRFEYYLYVFSFKVYLCIISALSFVYLLETKHICTLKLS